MVIEEIQDVCDHQAVDSSHVAKIDSLSTYFQETYISHPLPGREATFPIPMWNQREVATEGLARTTNTVEVWHFGIQAYFTGDHPSLWRLVSNLQKECAMQKFNFLQATSGVVVSRKRMYSELDEKINEVPSKSAQTDTISFLRGIASLTT